MTNSSYMAKLVMIQPHLTQLITRGVLYGILEFFCKE